jgi:hypothetical protein
MDAGAVAALIPIVAIGGFFTLLIVRMLSRVAMAKLEAQKLEAQREAASGAGRGHEEVVAALDELRREVAELAERVDFTERLLGQQRGGERLGPPRP